MRPEKYLADKLAFSMIMRRPSVHVTIIILIYLLDIYAINRLFIGFLVNRSWDCNKLYHGRISLEFPWVVVKKDASLDNIVSLLDVSCRVHLHKI